MSIDKDIDLPVKRWHVTKERLLFGGVVDGEFVRYEDYISHTDILRDRCEFYLGRIKQLQSTQSGMVMVPVDVYSKMLVCVGAELSMYEAVNKNKHGSLLSELKSAKPEANNENR